MAHAAHHACWKIGKLCHRTKVTNGTRWGGMCLERYSRKPTALNTNCKHAGSTKGHAPPLPRDNQPAPAPSASRGSDAWQTPFAGSCTPHPRRATPGHARGGLAQTWNKAARAGLVATKLRARASSGGASHGQTVGWA